MSSLRLLGMAAMLTLPVYATTTWWFEPFEARFRIEQTQASFRFSLDVAQPLYLDYGLIVHAGGGARPVVAIDLNGVEAARIVVDRPYAKSLRKIPLAAGAARAGENELQVRILDAADATVDLEGRLQNYFGIAPDFPRVIVVSDAMTAHARARAPMVDALRLLAMWAGSVFLLLVASRLLERRSVPSQSAIPAIVAALAAVPGAALVYSMLTPQHIWLSSEAVVVAALAVTAIAAGARAIARRRRTALRLAAVVALTLGALEIALRAFNYVRPHFLFYSDSYDRFRGRPGAPLFDTRLNSRGFNDVDHALDKPPNIRRRIVAIGDSFALGVVPYAANYLTLLETELAADGSVEVVNMGIAATGPEDYRPILVREGLAFDPDVVLVNVFIGNDLEIHRRRWDEYSYVAMLATGLWRLARERPPAAENWLGSSTTAAAGVYRDERPGFSRDRFLEIEVDRAWIYEPANPRVSEAVSRVVARVREMRDIAARAGAEFAVILLPDEAQVDAALRDEVAEAVASSAAALDVDQPNRLLLAALAASGIRALDLLPAFRAAGPVRLYKPYDTHWNLAGNRLAAQAIAQFLR